MGVLRIPLIIFIFIFGSGYVGREKESDDLEESGEVAAGAGSPCLALLFHPFARSQASSCPLLLLVVRLSVFHFAFGLHLQLIRLFLRLLTFMRKAIDFAFHFFACIPIFHYVTSFLFTFIFVQQILNLSCIVSFAVIFVFASHLNFVGVFFLEVTFYLISLSICSQLINHWQMPIMGNFDCLCI